MNLFDQLVDEALKNQPDLSTLRVVVEKELLHYDILRVLKEQNLLSDLTFIGGTALRSCYGGMRLSEDLDFTGGLNFSRQSLSIMSAALIKSLNEKYTFPVTISEPIKSKKNVNTWKIKIQTRPQKKHFPAQRINIDICSVPSYEKQPMMLLNTYGIDAGIGGLIIQTQSQEEIYTDKLLAFALRPNRIKHRDLWDITWLHQKGLEPNLNLIPKKLHDRNLNQNYFAQSFMQRAKLVSEDINIERDFQKEMKRFLPLKQAKQVEQNDFWTFVVYLINEFNKKIAVQ